MLGQLDPFTTYVPPANQEEFDNSLEGSFRGVGIQLNQRDDGKIQVVTPIDGSPAFKAGIEAGDIIQKVNGESIEGLRLEDVMKKVKGAIGTPVTLTVLHEDSPNPVDLSMTRQEVVVPTVKGYSRNPDNSWDYFATDDPKIGYIRLTQFTPDSFEEMKKAMTQLLSTGMKGLVLDLRWNPGGRLDEAVKIVNMFIDHGVIVSTEGRSRPKEVKTASAGNALPYFPMVVLVNEGSASASEIVSGSLKDNHRALIVGTRTYGKGSVQELIPLDGNSGELKLTVAYYYLPSGRLVHRKKDATDWGVDPQIDVPMDEATERKVADERYVTRNRCVPHAETDHQANHANRGGDDITDNAASGGHAAQGGRGFAAELHHFPGKSRRFHDHGHVGDTAFYEAGDAASAVSPERPKLVN